ncbi:membrane-bound PQQ-dependent dehydrogenase, glucose/quinate/shikimate family [Pseudomonas sp. L5B5]|uniref:membrane-bound PQQ-dependent dehydrogenase, glucose/quinate/shikimate family n=1 Tax=Pseudomonas sp. L5B5 TaxID=2883205 RepID=UPI001CFBC214|nr:membrane-bound PQQ-dependent dehydrogenase, glucose/quinate/shikimate family [Pseudomonas sp. L5B5]UCZ83136.1 membrane-bound PQQ-dependent dehydrogenase, glucose/quinate/shikimate family [Pseudomonas sp. L5B5]
MFTRVLAGGVALIGAALLVGGVWLLLLGGSGFYAVAGLMLGVVAHGLWYQRSYALGASVALLVMSLAWAWWEVGFDYWQWVPRVTMFLVVACIVTACYPQLRNSGGVAGARGVRNRLLPVLLGVLLVGVLSAFQPHPASVTLPGLEAAQAASGDAGPEAGDPDWPQYGQNTRGSRYSALSEIDTSNVAGLEVAWQYRTGDLPTGEAAFQGTPIKLGELLYVCTPYSKVVAVDAETGEQKWAYDPQVQSKEWQRCRGLASWHEAEAAPGKSEALCSTRIVLTTLDARLITLDAHNGAVCPGFGENGQVNLLDGLSDRARASYYPTSAPLVAGDVIVTGARMQDWAARGEPSGVVRGWDVRTGKLVWAWDPAAPKRGRPLPPGQIYPDETPNFWGTASYDPALGLIYVPTGNQTPDFWGADRSLAAETYNASVVAIDVRTGIDRWHFRTVNHDLHDYDVAAQPILHELPTGNGDTTPVVIVLTKTGQVFVLDRRDGRPVFPVESRPVSAAGAPAGQHPAPQQPYSSVSLGYTPLTEQRMWGMTALDQLYCRIQFKRMHYVGDFTPLSTRKSLMYPGYYGGINWGGGAVDESTGLLLVNDIRIAHWAQFIEHEQALAAGYNPTGASGNYAEQRGAPYGVIHGMFTSPLGVPCIAPPYGTLTAIDLKSGQIAWQVPMGSTEDTPLAGALSGLAMPIGMPTMGGPLVTQGGLVFFSGSMDYYLRAMDSRTGQVLWRGRLPVGSQATPISYQGSRSGRQYVVVTAGGAQGPDKARGDYVIAYRLP